MPRPAAHDRDAAVARALDLFWSRGFHAASLKDIEAALDMRPGSIYAAFDSKQGLYEAAIDAYARAEADLFHQAMQAAPGAIDGLIAYVRGIAGPNRPIRGCFVVRSLLESAGTNAAIRARAETVLQAVETRLAQALERARAAGEIAADADPARLARRLQGDIISARLQAERADGAARLAERLEDITAWLETLRRQGTPAPARRDGRPPPGPRAGA